MTESCSLNKEKTKSVEGFYTNLNFPDSRQATYSNSTVPIVGSRDTIARQNEINRILSTMTDQTAKIDMLNSKQSALREKTGDTILSQNESMLYNQYDDTLIDGHDVPSYLIKQGQTGGIEECKKSCDTNENCGGFSHWSGNDSCWMKDVSILPNPPTQSYDMSLRGDVYDGQYNAATNSTIQTKTSPVNRGGQGSVELTEEEKTQLSDTYLNTSSFCNGDNIYIGANSEQIKQVSLSEAGCAKDCMNDESCEMYLMSDDKTCGTYKDVSNISGYCKSGEGHADWGNVKNSVAGNITRYPQTGSAEGFSLLGSSEPPVREGFFWSSLLSDVEKVVSVPSKCEMQVIGDCTAWPERSNSGWFNDVDHGGKPAPTRGECYDRRNEWQEGCEQGDNNHVGVYSYYTPVGVSRSPTLPGPENTWTTYVKNAKEGFENSNANAPFSKVGPYKDAPNRALPDYVGTDSSANGIKSCSEKCKDYSYFGVQDGGQCFCGNDWDKATQYGKDNCGEMGGGWCNYIYKNRSSTTSQALQAQNEQRVTTSELDNTVSQYADNVEKLKQYNIDLTTMTETNSDAIEKALTEYNRNIGIVAASRDNQTWRQDHNLVNVSELTRSSRAYMYILWAILAVILLVLVLRNLK